MELDPTDLLLFARIAEAGSFSRAALRVGLPKSTLSRRLAALETHLGEKLMLRTTRKLSLTDFGLGVLEHARQLVAEVEATEALAQHRQSVPSGRLRMSMPADLAALICPLLADFSTRYPQLSLEIDLSPRRVDLVGENFDLAVRAGTLEDDASLAARRIGCFDVGLYAAADYLARRGTPGHPEDLQEHDALRLLTRGFEAAPWALQRGAERWEFVPPGRITINSPDLLLRLARAGSGIAAAPEYFVAPYVKSGEILRVLPQWCLPKATLWAVFPGRRLMPAKTRVLIDALVAVMGNAGHGAG